ncbi:hypothetical protein CCR78_02055 [Rhodovulum imhoffii]|nr:hypothetical protein [Rhodovulum imhoffii]
MFPDLFLTTLIFNRKDRKIQQSVHFRRVHFGRLEMRKTGYSAASVTSHPDPIAQYEEIQLNLAVGILQDIAYAHIEAGAQRTASLLMSLAKIERDLQGICKSGHAR